MEKSKSEVNITFIANTIKDFDIVALQKFDNIWYNSAKISVTNSKVIRFYKTFDTLKEAR